MATPITVVPAAGPSAPPRPPKTVPRKETTKLNFHFSPSRPGANDQNLLILLHGLGDTAKPFFDLGKQLNLPSTAVLSVEAPLQIPLLEEPSFMFYPSFTLPDFTPEPNPNPTRILSDLDELVAELKTCGWEEEGLHWLGFGQGATVAAEFALSYGRKHANRRFGSIVSVTGPLLSHPTAQPNGTPLLAVHRPARSSALSVSQLASLKKGFVDVQEVKFRSGEGMPRGAEEWRVVMTFWAKHLLREDVGSMGGGGEMYEVLSGGPKRP